MPGPGEPCRRRADDVMIRHPPGSRPTRHAIRRRGDAQPPATETMVNSLLPARVNSLLPPITQELRILRSPYDGSAPAWEPRRPPIPKEEGAPPPKRRGSGLLAGRLELNALALMFTTVASAGLGLVFWAVAARLYTEKQVGIGSAMISTLTLMATLAQFNLGNVYARFLPTAGRASRRFVFAGYAGVVAFGLLLGYGFLALGFGDGIFSTSADRLWFPAFIAVLAVFGLQDFVLIALQAAKFVPIENVIFSIVKIILLIVLANSLPHRGITVAWVIPAGIGVLIVTTLLRLRGLPHARSLEAPVGSLPDRRTLGGIVIGEYLSGAIGIVVPMALPLIIVWRLGPEANAYFAMPWLIASSLNLLIWNVASALLVEAAAEPAKAPALVKRALRLTLLIGGGGGLVLLAGAPFILGLLKPTYAAQGTDLLRAMALAVPFNAVIVAWTTLMRVHNRMILLVTQQVLSGIGILVVTLLLIPSIGVTGAGVGYLSVQATCGVVVALPLWRMLHSPGPDESAGQDGLDDQAGQGGPGGSPVAADTAPMPTLNGQRLPVASGHRGPVANGHRSPVSNGRRESVTNGQRGPVPNGQRGPEPNGQGVPAANGHHGLTATGQLTPIASGQLGLTANGQLTPVANGQPRPFANGLFGPLANGQPNKQPNGKRGPVQTPDRKSG